MLFLWGGGKVVIYEEYFSSSELHGISVLVLVLVRDCSDDSTFLRGEFLRHDEWCRSDGVVVV